MAHYEYRKAAKQAVHPKSPFVHPLLLLGVLSEAHLQVPGEATGFFSRWPIDTLSLDVATDGSGFWIVQIAWSLSLWVPACPCSISVTSSCPADSWWRHAQNHTPICSSHFPQAFHRTSSPGIRVFFWLLNHPFQIFISPELFTLIPIKNETLIYSWWTCISYSNANRISYIYIYNFICMKTFSSTSIPVRLAKVLLTKEEEVPLERIITDTGLVERSETIRIPVRRDTQLLQFLSVLDLKAWCLLSRVSTMVILWYQWSVS